MSIVLMRSCPDSLPRPWESLGAFIERTMIGWPRPIPVFHKDLSAKRIGWLDSCRMPSRIHVTQDDGESTVCRYFPRNCHRSGRWEIVPSVPSKDHGRSRFCKTCFRFTPKTIPWVDPSPAPAVEGA